MNDLPARPPLALAERRRWSAFFWPVGIALLGCAAMPLDLPIARWFYDGHCPSEILRWLSFAETYAYGFGVACILLTVFALDPQRRIYLPRVAATAFGGGLLANMFKMSVARTRPHDFFPKRTEEMLAAGSRVASDITRTVGDTFGQWLPLGKVASAQQSFPSGHMATAFGLTAALCWLYPRGQWVFVLFAILAGCQRMSSWSHFLSDVIWGASIGCFSMLLFLPGGLLAHWFDRLESFLDGRRRGKAAAAIADHTVESPGRNAA